MMWLNIVLATILCLGLSVGGLIFATRKNPRLDAMTVAERQLGKDRANRTALSLGEMVLGGLQFGFGLLGVVPALALGWWALQGFEKTPSMATTISYLVMWIIGWMIFGKIVRLTDALSDNPEVHTNEAG